MSKRQREDSLEHESPSEKTARVGQQADLNHSDYTVGWICALPKEQTAAIAMLDERHPDIDSPVNDDNIYILGSIGGHNIAITCLPKGRYGTNSAATIATRMISTFPSIKFGLLVGIGGGIPSKVRLGDVVVSTPIDQYPGVVQWDFGKAEVDGGFRRTGLLNNPPSALLIALSKLESEHELCGETKIPEILDKMKQKWPKLNPKYFWNSSLKDALRKSDISSQDRVNSEIEQVADAATNVLINELPMRHPQVHYGLIASGNQVIKDAVARDRLDENLGGNVLCIEMEAAGLMNDFPCLVIRGICDYADSSKNKDWQEYAAAVAAACAKEVLSVLQGKAVEHMDSIKDTLSVLNEQLGGIRKTFNEITSRQYSQDHKEFLDWLTPLDYTTQQTDYFSKRQQGTGEWLLNSATYRDWVENSQETLFCPGIPGAGKTILTAMVVNDLFERFSKDETVGIAYIYCNFRRNDEQKFRDLLLSLGKQLAQSQCSMPKNGKDIFDQYKVKKERPSIADARKLLESMAALYSRIFIIIDALDECQESDGCRSNLLEEVFRLQDGTKANFFATSRFIPEITEKFKACKFFEIRASEQDVRKYVHDQIETGTIEHLPSLVKNKPGLKEEVVKAISVAVDGMFLLAKIYLDSLVDKITVADVREALGQLPRQLAGSGEIQKLEILNKAYEFAWERINAQKDGFKNIAIRVLTWITCAKRPLSTSELQHALAVKVNDEELDEDAIPQVRDMVSFCAGLVTIDEESNIVRLVHYTTQEYFDKKKSNLFPNAETMITTICITYLSFRAFGAEYDPGVNYEERGARLQTYPFYKYASSYWGRHAYIAGGQLGETAITFLMNENKTSRASEEILYGYTDEMPPATGLHLAAHFGLWEAINVLVERGCNVNAEHELISTPLLFAVREGHANAVGALIDNGAEFRGTNVNWYIETAIGEGHESVVKILLEKGVDVEAAVDDMLTPLVQASTVGHEAVVKLLLQKNADIEGRRSKLNTPLTAAVWRGHKTIVDLLLEWGADIEAVDSEGNTPLRAAILARKGSMIQFLLEKGADISVKDSNGHKPLFTAAKYDCTAAIPLLLEKGANIHETNHEGHTPLTFGAMYDSSEAMDLLLNKGANIDAANFEGHTPLLIAARYGCAAAVELLLESGAKIDTLDNRGWTPLAWAAQEEQLWCKTQERRWTQPNYKVVRELLIEKGAGFGSLQLGQMGRLRYID